MPREHFGYILFCALVVVGGASVDFVTESTTMIVIGLILAFSARLLCWLLFGLPSMHFHSSPASQRGLPPTTAAREPSQRSRRRCSRACVTRLLDRSPSRLPFTVARAAIALALCHAGCRRGVSCGARTCAHRRPVELARRDCNCRRYRSSVATAFVACSFASPPGSSEHRAVAPARLVMPRHDQR